MVALALSPYAEALGPAALRAPARRTPWRWSPSPARCRRKAEALRRSPRNVPVGGGIIRPAPGGGAGGRRIVPARLGAVAEAEELTPLALELNP